MEFFIICFIFMCNVDRNLYHPHRNLRNQKLISKMVERDQKVILQEILDQECKCVIQVLQQLW